MIELRDYQESLLEGLREEIRRKVRNILAVLPTGGGKTVIAGFLAREVTSRGKTIWFLCHRNFLELQTSLTFTQLDLPHGFITSSNKYAPHSIMVCGVQTLVNRYKEMIAPDVMVWDEAHHCVAPSWLAMYQWAQERGTIQIGLTATPERLDGKGMKPPFEAMVMGPTTRLLMERGFLSGFTCFCPTSIDRAALLVTAGDYNIQDLEEEVTRKVIVGDVVGHYRRITHDISGDRMRRAVYFCPSVRYSQSLAAQFCEAGIPARHIDKDTSPKDRTQAAKDLASGALQVLCNVGLLGEGYDLSAQAGCEVTVDVVGLLRPTMSLALHRQQVGRALRPKDYDAIIIDHVGNIAAHGFPSDDVEWDLEGRQSRKTSTSRVQICKHCGAANTLHAVSCIVCKEPLKEQGVVSEPEEVEGTLVEVKPGDFESDRARMEKRRKEAARQRILNACTTYEDFQKAEKELGYKRGWAFHAYKGYKAQMARLQALYDDYRR